MRGEAQPRKYLEAGISLGKRNRTHRKHKGTRAAGRTVVGKAELGNLQHLPNFTVNTV